MIARLAIRQRAVSIEANISVKKISLPQAPPPPLPPKKEALPPGIEPRHYYPQGHIATTTPRGNIKKGRGALPPGIEPRTSYARGHIGLALASLH